MADGERAAGTGGSRSGAKAVIEVERAGPVGVIRLNRPEKANAYNQALLDQLAAAINTMRDVAVVVICATGKTFCAGADLDEMAGRRARGDWQAALGLRSQAVFTALARAPFVSIASVQGAAIAGGFELALACDLRIVGPAARFSLPETRLGIVPSAGGLTRLARLCGVSVAKGVVLGGGTLNADDALRIGLVHRAGDNAAAMSWAQELADRDATAQTRAKERIDALESDLALDLERAAQAGLYRA